jgi:hypothetical protein
MRIRRTLPPLLAIVSMLAALMFTSSPAGAAPTDLTPSATAGGTYHALTPTRIVDTRSGIGVAAGAVPADGTIDFAVAGAGGVPASGAGSVVLNVTAVDPTSTGYVNVYPGLLPKPSTEDPSSLNFAAGQNVANQVTVTLGTNGGLSAYNANGSTHILVDVVGWYDVTGTGGGRYNPIAPARIMDSRSGIGGRSTPLAEGETANLKVTGVGGVPASGVSAVTVNLTATDQTSAGFLTVYPQAGTVPNVSNLNFVRGVSRANLVTVGVNASNGQISIFNSNGSTQVIVDVVGWYDAAGSAGSLYHGVTPTRIADTRPVDAPLREGEAAAVGFHGQAEVPNNATGVILNVTAVDPSSAGFLTVYPGATVPNASNVNWQGPGVVVPNAVVTSLPASGEANFLNAFGTVHVLIDVFGYFAAT